MLRIEELSSCAMIQLGVDPFELLLLNRPKGQVVRSSIQRPPLQLALVVFIVQ